MQMEKSYKMMTTCAKWMGSMPIQLILRRKSIEVSPPSWPKPCLGLQCLLSAVLEIRVGSTFVVAIAASIQQGEGEN